TFMSPLPPGSTPTHGAGRRAHVLAASSNPRARRRASPQLYERPVQPIWGMFAPPPAAIVVAWEVRPMPETYDVIIIGSGAGGGTLAHTLAGTGKRILLLERGTFLPREMDNWSPERVFIDGKYISPDTWYDADGTPFQPQVHYFVGGATKLYGA